MKILDPVETKDIEVPRRAGRLPNPFYEEVLNKAMKLRIGKSLPVECESISKVTQLRAALKKKIDADEMKYYGLNLFNVGLKLYVHKRFGKKEVK